MKRVDTGWNYNILIVNNIQL